MMSIVRISRLRDCGVFRDFTWPTDLPAFGRYNVIYGWNWSGKTTLSRVFRALEMKTVVPNGEVTLRAGQSDICGNDFPQATLGVRVFNRDFVAENLFPVGGGDVPPIFVVGKESVEKQKDVEQRKRTLAEAQTQLETNRSKRQQADRAFDRFCIDRARIIKDTLRSSGPNPYNNYDKSDFQKRAQKMLADGDKDASTLDDVERQKLLAQQKASPKPKLALVSFQLPAIQSLRAAVSQLLSATIVSNAIQSLKDDPAVSGWVHQGLALHREREAERCLFCDRAPLPRDRLAALEAHFSTEYEQFLKTIDAQIAAIQAESKAAEALSLPKRTELYEDLGDDYETASTAFLDAVRSAKTFLDSLVQALTDKRSRPFESLSLDVVAPEIDSGAVGRLNEVIGKHNQACDDFQTRIAEARRRLEADWVARELDEFVMLSDAVQAAIHSVEGTDGEVRRQTGEIASLERQIVEHRQPAEELNEELHKYLGHDELRLEVKDTGYTITRSGLPAQALSEGETTAIALLYFLKSLLDRRFDMPNGVVVLDDPVSSLDANALYLAFGFIRDRTQDAGQLFILTHNFTFFRQVRNWFHHLKGQKKKDVTQRPARFYMLDCAHEQGHRYTTLRSLDPLLERYNSEYHYMFARIHRAAKESPQADLEHNYALPNMARRLLEAFLAFRQPQVSGELWQKLQAVQFDGPKKTRILRFVHTQSHSDSIGEPEHDLSQLAEAPSVLNDLLDLIQSQDPDHFSAMEKLLVSPSDTGDDE